MIQTCASARSTAAIPDDEGPPWLLVPDGRIPTTAIIEPALRAAVGPSPMDVFLLDEIRLEKLASHRLVFSRVCAPEFVWLPRWLGDHGARYAYFLDDNLWAYRAESDVGAYYARPDVRDALDHFLRHAACILVNTVPLADVVRQRHPHALIRVVPPPMEIVDRRADSGPAIRPLRVGYAGTERGAAFGPVVDAMRRAAAARPGHFAFEFIGHVPDALRGDAGVSFFPGVADYRAFLEFKASRGWDVGLAPLDDNEFTRAKTNNKYREYGALGIAGIYSDVKPYRDCVTHGVDGLLVANESSAWFRALLQLAADRDACAAMGRHAKEGVWRRHRIDVVAPAWRDALKGAGIRPARPTGRAVLEAYLRRAEARWRVRASAYLSILRDRGPLGLLRHLAVRLRHLLGR